MSSPVDDWLIVGVATDAENIAGGEGGGGFTNA